MSVSNANAIKYQDLTDEIITDVSAYIEMFVKSEQYWDKFCNPCSMPRGAKTFYVRRLMPPAVAAADIAERAEFVAPRPSKIVVATFEKTVANYGDKAIYSREDVQYHKDDTVKSIGATLKEIAVQKLDLIKGAAFVSSRATLTYDATNGILETLENGSIILQKNKAKRWDGVHWLVHLTPEAMKAVREKITARGAALSEPTKGQLDGVSTAVGSYGDFLFSVTTSDVLYDLTAGTQKLVIMGKRGVDGASPVDCCKLVGEAEIQVIHNPLGSGVLLDVDGNLTSDDNKQQGSVAINMDGLGACISDDLCILNCEFTLAAVAKSAVDIDDLNGYVSHSPAGE